MKKSLLAISFAILLMPGVQAATRFKVHVEIANSPAEGASNVSPGESSDETVTLGEGYLSWQTASRLEVLDFAKRRRIVADLAGKTLVDYSLYDAVGFRERELRNRMGLASALAAAKVREPGPVSNDEHVLSIQLAPDFKPVVHTTPDATLFARGDVELLRVSLAAHKVDASDAHRFVQFLRYRFGGHPAILSQLEQKAAIPAAMQFTFDEMVARRKVSLSISDVQQTAPPAYALDGFARRSQDAIDQLFDRVDAGNAADTRKALNEAISQGFRDRNMLDVVLAMTELSLSTGEAPAPFTPEQVAQLNADPAVMRFRTAMSMRQKTDLAKGIAMLNALEFQTSRAYMLKLYQANDYAMLGDLKAASALFIQVLKARPLLAGAYKDFGDVMLVSFDTPRAWRSWDAGRRIAPQAPAFVPVNQYEAALARQYPDYF